MHWDGPYEFASWFADTFVDPVFRTLSEHSLLGFTLDKWFFGIFLFGIVKLFMDGFFHKDKGNEKG